MASSQLLKERLLRELERLPEDSLSEVLDFVSFLLWQKSRSTRVDERQSVAPNLDPLQTFIGGVEHGSLAQRIEEDLYGR